MKRPDVKIIPLDDANLERGIGFITRLNQIPAHGISYLGQERHEITADVKAIQPPEGYGFLAVSDREQIVGLFGVEMDMELGRCWLFGPFTEHYEWDMVADLLYEAILEALPGEITNQDLYFHDENTRVREFALRQGFGYYTAGATLALDKGQVPHTPKSSILDPDDGYVDQFISLHSDIFPNTYYSGQQLLKLAQADDKRLFVHQVNGRLVGYIFIQVREAARDGYIDFIGVEESFRRQGIGKDLAASGIDWAFGFPFVKKVTLTVKPDNIPAMRMYQGLGFKTQSLAQAYRKQT